MHTLKTRITCLTIALVLALLGGVGWFEDRTLGNDFLALLRQQQGTLTQTVADDLDDRLAMHLGALERLAKQLGTSPPTDPEAIRAMLNGSGLRSMFDGIGLIGLDGVMVATDRAAGPPGASLRLADRDYFKQALAQGRPVISEPLASRVSGQPIVVMVVPVRDAAGRMTALLGGTLDLSHPNALGRLAQAKVGATGHYVVTTRSGAQARYVVHPDPAMLLQPVAPADAAGQAADVVTRAIVRTPNWELRAVLPADEASAPVQAARQRLYLLMVLLALASAVLAWFGSRALMAPLAHLLATMRQLRESPGAPVSLDLDARDERGDLAREFDALMSELNERQAQLAASIEACPLGLFQASVDGALHDVNDMYLRILGLAREDAASGWLEMVDPADRERTWAAWLEITAGDRTVHVQRRLTRRDGRPIHVSVRMAPVIVQGRVVGHTGTLSDITDRVESEQAVRTLAAILESTPDLVMQADADGRLVYMNPAARRRNGLSPDAPVDRWTIGDFTAVPQAAAQGLWLGETEATDLAGRSSPCATTLIAHQDAAGQRSHYSMILRDVSAEKQAVDALQRQADLLRTLAETVPDMVAVVDRSQCFVFANQAYEHYFGSAPDGLLGRRVREVLGDVEFERCQGLIARALTGEAVVYDKQSMRDPRRHFEVSYTPVRRPDGTVPAYVVIARDITEQHHEQSRLRDLAERDPMTGLLNRAGFEVRFAELCRSAAAGAGSVALLYLDLDHFKEVNDTHGHGVGDELLRIFAKRLDHLVRPSDAVARLGGDEFAIALANVRTLQNAERVADKILHVAHEPFHVGHTTLRVGASVGLALWRPGDGDGQALVQRADGMLYEAKNGGRGRRASEHVLM